MFAVSGWNVSIDKLKAETSTAPSTEPNVSTTTPSTKRKRSKPSNVTADNVADLWERVIEKREPNESKGNAKKLSGSERRRQKRERKAEQNGSNSHEGGDVADGQLPPVKKQKKEKPTKSKKREDDEGKRGDEATKTSKLDPTQSKAGQPTPPPAKLTPLQASMREKLVSARFRHLNETLYTKPSAEALRLFDDAPDMFAEYHEGFRRQVAVWPENPVDGYIADIKARGKLKPFAPRDRPAQVPGPALSPLPRTAGTCTVADLGCGDARLAAALAKSRHKLRLDIRSFDLHSAAAGVTRADMAALPLADGAVDLAVSCLALMGTNWLDFVEEAYRVLRWKGELWVAEIKSRFGDPTKKKAKVVEHSVGARKKGGGAGGKKAEKEKEDKAAEIHAADLAVEVDGQDDRRRETDVSAFVAALGRRGFLLAGEASEAVDLSNRMFVKLRFVKAATPVRGKGALKGRESGSGGMKKRFLGGGDAEGDAVSEANVLKPCVYKLR